VCEYRKIGVGVEEGKYFEPQFLPFNYNSVNEMVSVDLWNMHLITT
jgi:hypothetical protein